MGLRLGLGLGLGLRLTLGFTTRAIIIVVQYIQASQNDAPNFSSYEGITFRPILETHQIIISTRVFCTGYFVFCEFI